MARRQRGGLRGRRLARDEVELQATLEPHEQERRKNAPEQRADDVEPYGTPDDRVRARSERGPQRARGVGRAARPRPGEENAKERRAADECAGKRCGPWVKRSPMMALGKADRILSVKELILLRAPGRNVRCYFGSG